LVVRIKRKEEYRGSVTPSALNTETDIINLGTYEDSIILEGYVDTRGLQSGDSITLRIYVKVDGTTSSKLDEVNVSAPLTSPVIHLLSMTLPKDSNPRVTVTQTAGTLRTLYYWFVVQVLEVI